MYAPRAFLGADLVALGRTGPPARLATSVKSGLVPSRIEVNLELNQNHPGAHVLEAALGPRSQRGKQASEVAALMGRLSPRPTY